MKKILMTTAIGAALLFGTMSANAVCPCQDKDLQGPPPPPPEHSKIHKPMPPEVKAEMERRKAEMDKRLNITEEQKAQLKSIHEKSRAEIAPKIKQLSEAEYELSVLDKRKLNSEKYGIATLEEVKLSGKSAEELRAEIKTLKEEIREIKKANFEASQDVFTEKQKKELEKMRQEKLKKHPRPQKPMHKFGKPVPPPEIR